jgi:CubicO group peptidase (beta-lactamase class C family)
MGQRSLYLGIFKPSLVLVTSLMIALLVASLPANAQFGGGGSAFLRNQVDGYMLELADTGFSGAILIALGGDIVLRKGYGVANDWDGTAVSRDTAFDIATLANQFTAAGILLLEERGALNVNDPISSYLANVPADKADVTIHQLLTHTGGFSDVAGIPGTSGILESTSRDAALNSVLGENLIGVPGQAYAYSDSGYLTLAAITEIASGQKFTDFITENIFEPARLSNSGFYGDSKWSNIEVANGYVDGNDYGSPSGWPTPSWAVLGFGGIVSTVYDLYLWDYSLQNNTLLSAESTERLFTEYATIDSGEEGSYGYGWSIQDSDEGSLVTNNGGSLGGSSDFSRYIDPGLLVIVLSNRSELRNAPGPDSEIRLYATETSRQLASNIFANDFSAQPTPYYKSINIQNPSSGGGLPLYLIGLVLAAVGLVVILLKR